MRRVCVLVALAAACGDRDAEDPAAAPPPPAAVVAEKAPAGGVQLEIAYPITEEDVGDVMLASGTVVGSPGPTGFFLRGERNNVVFVQSTVPVTDGARVRAVGPLRAADGERFLSWERSLLPQPEPIWAVLRGYYVDATEVTPIER